MQISTKPQPAKKLIDASLPKNISLEEKNALEKKWSEQAKFREDAIARETRIPTDATVTLKFQLRRFGKHWQSYCLEKGKIVSLLPAPSLLSSAIDALTDKMADQANGA